MDWTAIIGYVASIITAIGGFFIGKRKQHIEEDSSLIQNLQQSLDFYKKLSDDNQKRLDELLKKNQELENEVKELKIKVEKLIDRINLLQDDEVISEENI